MLKKALIAVEAVIFAVLLVYSLHSCSSDWEIDWSVDKESGETPIIVQGSTGFDIEEDEIADADYVERKLKGYDGCFGDTKQDFIEYIRRNNYVILPGYYKIYSEYIFSDGKFRLPGTPKDKAKQIFSYADKDEYILRKQQEAEAEQTEIISGDKEEEETEIISGNKNDGTEQ